MPSSKNYKRDLKQEYKRDKARGDKGSGSNSPDAKRHRAKRAYEKKHGAVPAGKDVGHVKSLKSGGSNKMANLRVQSASANRSAGGKSGSRVGKAAGGRKGTRK